MGQAAIGFLEIKIVIPGHVPFFRWYTDVQRILIIFYVKNKKQAVFFSRTFLKKISAYPHFWMKYSRIMRKKAIR